MRRRSGTHMPARLHVKHVASVVQLSELNERQQRPSGQDVYCHVVHVVLAVNVGIAEVRGAQVSRVGAVAFLVRPRAIEICKRHQPPPRQHRRVAVGTLGALETTARLLPEADKVR